MTKSVSSWVRDKFALGASMPNTPAIDFSQPMRSSNVVVERGEWCGPSGGTLCVFRQNQSFGRPNLLVDLR